MKRVTAPAEDRRARSETSGDPQGGRTGAAARTQPARKDANTANRWTRQRLSKRDCERGGKGRPVYEHAPISPPKNILLRLEDKQ